MGCRQSDCDVGGGDLYLPYSGGVDRQSICLQRSKIVREGQQPLSLAGSLMASELVLERLEIVYDDEAVFAVLAYLPESLLTLQPGFDLEWLDVEPRR